MSIADAVAPPRTVHAFAVDGEDTRIDDVVPLDGTPGHVCVVGGCASGKSTTVSTLVENRLRTTDGDGEPLTRVALCNPFGVGEYGDLSGRVAAFAGDFAALGDVLGWLRREMAARAALRERLRVPVLPASARTPHIVLAFDDFSAACARQYHLPGDLHEVLRQSRRLNVSVIAACDDLSSDATGGGPTRALLAGARAVLLRNVGVDLAPMVFGAGIGNCRELPRWLPDGSSAAGAAFLVGFPFPAYRAVRILRGDGFGAADAGPVQPKIDVCGDAWSRS